MPNRVAIIPARGGSKRIPRKNIRSFLGEPIIAYPIKALQESQLFDRIIVSTDDEEIAEIAIKYGAEVPFFRSSENSTDTAGTLPVIQEVIEQLSIHSSNVDTICCVYPTSVFIDAALIAQAVDHLENNQFTSVVAVTAYSHPIQRAIQKNGSTIQFKNPENRLIRTQELEIFYHDTGQLYILSGLNIHNETSIFTENTGCIELSSTFVQDIDNPEDWQLAELKYQLLHKNSR